MTRIFDSGSIEFFTYMHKYKLWINERSSFAIIEGDCYS